MSDLRPEGTSIQMGGKERRILLSIEAIDAIQSTTNLPLLDAIMRVAQVADGNTYGEDGENMKVFGKVLLAEMLAAGEKVKADDINRIKYKEIGGIATGILKEFGVATPEEEEDEDDDDEDEDSPKEESEA